MKEVEEIITSVDNFINNLPEPLKGMGQDFSKNGFSCREAFIKNDMAFPGLHLPIWLSEKYGTHDRKLTREIVKGALLGYLYIRIQDDVYDHKEGNDSNWLLVANEFIREFFKVYYDIFPPKSIFWNYFNKAWLDFSQATAWEIRTCRGILNNYSVNELLNVGKKLSFAKVPVTAVGLMADKEKDLPIMFKIVDLLATSSQLLNDFASLLGDLKTNHFTYPLSCALTNSEDNLFECLLQKDSIEQLFKKVIDLDQEILLLLSQFPLEPLSVFIRERINKVEDMRRRYFEIKINALMNR